MAEPVLEMKEMSKPTSRGLGLWGFGIANLLVTLVVSIAVWFLFVDPKVSLLKTYPQPFGLFLFWSILGIIFLAFCWEMWPLNSVKQPLKGLLAVILCSAIALAGIALTNYLYGALDPAFRLGGLKAMGWTSSGMIVLIGFLPWGGFGGNWDNWPWKDAGLKQPLLGLALFLTGLALAIPLYMFLIYPNVAVWSSPANIVLPLATVVGWFYSVIVSCFMSANTLENWPWTSIFRSRWSVALGSFIGNFIVGTGIYFFFLYLLKTWLIPGPAQQVLGQGINSFAAELGVCMVAWIMIWLLAFGNYPNTDSPSKNRLIRSLIVFVLGIATFIIYYSLAVPVLHEPAIAGSFGGDALTFMDIVVMILLYYTVCFESYGLSRKLD